MKRKLLLLPVCALCLAVTGFFGLRFCRQIKEYRTGEQTYQALTQYVRHSEAASDPAVSQAEPEAPSAETAPQEPAAEAGIQVDFEALWQINPDVVAWIYIEGTNIHYPVVQGPDNSYYLDRMVDGSYNGAGSLFLDYRNAGDFSQRHSVIYGHNMKNGTMFRQITQYKEQEFYEAHPTGLLITPEGTYTLVFFAGYVTDMNSQAWKLEFGSQEEYAQWLEDAVSHSAFTGGGIPTAQDRVVTFSTCTYDYNDARFVLLGLLKQ